MPFLSISGTGIKIVLSSPLTILTCSVIPKDDIYLGMTTMALLLLCFLQIYAFKEVPYSSLSQQKPAQTPRLRAVFETGGIYKHYSGSSNTSFKNPEDDDDLFEDIPDWTWLEITITGLAAVTVVASIGAVLISTSRIVLVNGLVALLIPPYSAFQEQKITECKGNYGCYFRTLLLINLLSWLILTLAKYKVFDPLHLCSNREGYRKKGSRDEQLEL